MLHFIERTQLLNTKPETAWEFMRNPANLAQITPDYMGFEIVSQTKDSKMYPGQIIEYYVKPIAGIKLHWVTEITHVNEGVYFVDEQRFGPYTFWHHKHFLEPVADGVLMTDQVHYKIPLGILGKLANTLFIKKQLTEIFDYRHKILEELFNTPSR